MVRIRSDGFCQSDISRPYQICFKTNRENTIYYNLKCKEVEVFVGIVENKLERGGHSVVLCSKHDFRR